MGVRLLPWRPRVREVRDFPDSGSFDLPDLGDDIGFGLALAVLLLVVLAFPFLLVLLLFSLELALVLLLVPLVMAGQLVGLLPWVLVLRYDGAKRYHEVRGTRAMLAARAHFRSRIGTSALA